MRKVILLLIAASLALVMWLALSPDAASERQRLESIVDSLDHSASRIDVVAKIGNQSVMTQNVSNYFGNTYSDSWKFDRFTVVVFYKRNDQAELVFLSGAIIEGACQELRWPRIKPKAQ